MNPLQETSGTFFLFVYGTLRRGGIRHGLLAQQRFLGEVQTLPGYALLDFGDYPGLVWVEVGGEVIHGELYEVDCRLIGELDAVEGAPDLFRLEDVQIRQHPGPVWAYFYQGDIAGHPWIESGNWEN